MNKDKEELNNTIKNAKRSEQEKQTEILKVLNRYFTDKQFEARIHGDDSYYIEKIHEFIHDEKRNLIFGDFGGFRGDIRDLLLRYILNVELFTDFFKKLEDIEAVEKFLAQKQKKEGK
jgi:hypothetical protein